MNLIGAREMAGDLLARRSRHGGYGQHERTDLEKEYTDAEVEFLMAMRLFMSVNRVRFPQFTDCLAVLLTLGYRKAGADSE